MLDVDTLSGAITTAARWQGASFREWYPQGESNAPAERNFTVHLAAALGSLRGTRFYAEADIPAEGGEHERIDLVAYWPASSTLLVVEAKSFLEKNIGGIHDDLDRIRRFELAKPAARARRKWGMVLTSTTDAECRAWWKSRSQPRPGKCSSSRWTDVGNHLREHATLPAGCRNAVKLYSKGTYSNFDRWLLYAFWLERG